MSVFCRDRVNPQMFIYALSVAILHRPDTKDLPIPPLTEVFPDKYIDSGVFARAREEANIVPTDSRVCVLADALITNKPVTRLCGLINHSLIL